MVSREVTSNQMLGGQQMGPLDKSVIPCQVHSTHYVLFCSSPQVPSIGSLTGSFEMAQSHSRAPRLALYLAFGTPMKRGSPGTPPRHQVQLMTTLIVCLLKTHFMLRKIGGCMMSHRPPVLPPDGVHFRKVLARALILNST